jgi:hypothetical protein
MSKNWTPLHPSHIITFQKMTWVRDSSSNRITIDTNIWGRMKEMRSVITIQFPSTAFIGLWRLLPTINARIRISLGINCKSSKQVSISSSGWYSTMTVSHRWLSSIRCSLRANNIPLWIRGSQVFPASIRSLSFTHSNKVILEVNSMEWSQGR